MVGGLWAAPSSAAAPVATPAWTRRGCPPHLWGSIHAAGVVVVSLAGAEHRSAPSLCAPRGSAFGPFIIALLGNGYSKTHFQSPARCCSGTQGTPALLSWRAAESLCAWEANDHLKPWQRSGRATATCRPLALRAVRLRQRLGTGCWSRKHASIPCWSLQAWGKNYSGICPLVPLQPPWLCRGSSITHAWGQGAAVRLKGKHREERGCLETWQTGRKVLNSSSRWLVGVVLPPLIVHLTKSVSVAVIGVS